MAEKEAPVCACTVIHSDRVEDARGKIPPENTLHNLGDFFKILGDPTRLKILHALTLHELCVCDIAALLGMHQSAVSHQLKVLRQARFVRFRREGKIIYYILEDRHVADIFAQGLMHISEK